jgi:hypothetical protein
LNQLLQRYLAFAILVLLGHLDLLLGYPTDDLWVLLCTPRTGGQVLSAQYDKKDRCLGYRSDCWNLDYNHQPFNAFQNASEKIVIFSLDPALYYQFVSKKSITCFAVLA